MTMPIARNTHAAATLAAALLAAAVSLPPAAAGAAEPQPTQIEVKIDNFTFAPQHITVKAGTTVTWINEDDIPHTVAATGKLFKSKVLDTGDKYSFTFTTAGSFEYFCSLHPHMTASIAVEAATGSNATQ
jgi:plastocyanin